MEEIFNFTEHQTNNQKAKQNRQRKQKSENTNKMCPPPMCRYAKNKKPNKSALSSFSFAFHLCTKPLSSIMKALDSISSCKPRSMSLQAIE